MLFSFENVRANSSRMLYTTQRAFLGYKNINRGTKLLTQKISQQTFGEYKDEAVLILAPLVYGEVNYQLDSTMFFYNFRESTVGLKYSYRF
jgi:hypothetical protein